MRIACFIPLLSSCFAAAAQSPADTPWQFVAQWDNDIFAGDDNNYTNGGRVAFLQELAPGMDADTGLRRLLYPLSGADESPAFGDWRLRGTEDLRFAWGFGLTQLMFTPDDPNAPTAPDGERPYAGWLGLELSLHAKDEVSVSSVTLSLGTTGENSYADELQTWVHEEITDGPVFQGWDSQVPGEATINLHFDHKRSLGFTPDAEFGFDGYWEWGAALGNFRTDAYLGSLLRAGYNLPATYSIPRLQLGSYGHELFRPADADASPFSALGFIGLRATAVAHDITLDGPVFRDFDTGVAREPFVGELLIGLSLHYKSCELSLSHTLRSDEFEGQSDKQTFGSVLLRLSTCF